MGDFSQWSELGQAIGGIAAGLTFLAVVVGGVVGLRRYRHGQKIGSAELLLKLEEEFRTVVPTCAKWDSAVTYDSIIRPAISAYMAGERLDEDAVGVISELDRCLRFFYVCSVMHGDLRIEQSVVARSYYWYMRDLLDPDGKHPELLEYVKRYYRRLHVWLLRHEPCFEHYGKEGEWVSRKALKESTVLERLREARLDEERPPVEAP